MCSQNRTKHTRSCKQDIDYCLIDEDDRPVDTDDESISSYDPTDDEEDDDDDDDDCDEDEDENVSFAFSIQQYTRTPKEVSGVGVC